MHYGQILTKANKFLAADSFPYPKMYRRVLNGYSMGVFVRISREISLQTDFVNSIIDVVARHTAKNFLYVSCSSPFAIEIRDASIKLRFAIDVTMVASPYFSASRSEAAPIVVSNPAITP